MSKSTVYEQRIYHAMPSRMPDLLARFQHVTLPIWARLDIHQAGFWTVEVGGSNHDLIYLLRWSSMAEREEKWAIFRSGSRSAVKRSRTAPSLVRTVTPS
jgi:hypothetical protein